MPHAVQAMLEVGLGTMDITAIDAQDAGYSDLLTLFLFPEWRMQQGIKHVSQNGAY